MTESSNVVSPISQRSIFVISAISSFTCWITDACYPVGPLLTWFTGAILSLILAGTLQSRSRAVSGGGMIAVGIIAMLYVVMDAHSVPPMRLQRLRIGDSMAKVELELGTPTTTTSAGEKQSWTYTGPTWCLVTVVIDPNGKVESIDHDH